MDSILKILIDSSVGSFDLSTDKNELMFYGNDDDFVIGLDKTQVQQLINELQSLHDQMVD